MPALMHYRSDIQGLRAIAVLLVMLFHFNPAWFLGGFVGVDVLLLIAGCLIVSILLAKKAQPDIDDRHEFGAALHIAVGTESDDYRKNPICWAVAMFWADSTIARTHSF